MHIDQKVFWENRGPWTCLRRFPLRRHLKTLKRHDMQKVASKLGGSEGGGRSVSRGLALTGMTSNEDAVVTFWGQRYFRFADERPRASKYFSFLWRRILDFFITFQVSVKKVTNIARMNFVFNDSFALGRFKTQIVFLFWIAGAGIAAEGERALDFWDPSQDESKPKLWE